MSLAGRKVAITGAARGFGRLLALRLAAQRTVEECTDGGAVQAHAFACDVSSASSVRGFAGDVAQLTDRVDILVNNAARYLDAGSLEAASDEEIADTVASGATGTLLIVKHFLPLLRGSSDADIVTMISACGEAGHRRSTAHEAFYAAKSAQAGLVEILSARLRPAGVRVISLYPPDFDDAGEDSTAKSGAAQPLRSGSVADCVLFALQQPRDCYIRSFHFEQACLLAHLRHHLVIRLEQPDVCIGPDDAVGRRWECPPPRVAVRTAHA